MASVKIKIIPVAISKCFLHFKWKSCIEASGLGWSVELLCSLDITDGSGDSWLSWTDSHVVTSGTATAAVNGLQK